MNRGRGRPTLGTTPVMGGKAGGVIRTPTGMVYKQAMAGGGSVLVPTSYQLSGGQVYQVRGLCFERMIRVKVVTLFYNNNISVTDLLTT